MSPQARGVVPPERVEAIMAAKQVAEDASGTVIAQEQPSPLS